MMHDASNARGVTAGKMGRNSSIGNKHFNSTIGCNSSF